MYVLASSPKPKSHRQNNCLLSSVTCGQVSDQAVRLWQEGWFQNGGEPSGVSILRDPKVRARRERMCP